MADDRVLTDVADALVSHQQVDWRRCAEGGQRRALANLRAVANLFARRTPEPASALRSDAGDVRAGHRGLRLLLAVSLLEASAALAVLPWMWPAYHRAYGPGAVYLAVILVGYLACAAPLLLGGRRDERAWLLGVYFALMASVPTAHMLPFFLWGAAPVGEVGYSIHLHPFVFRPAVLWWFTREFPRVHRRSRFDETARRMVAASAVVGVAAWAGLLPLRVLGQRGSVPLEFLQAYQDATFAVLTLLETAAIVALILRARGASPDDLTRVALFGGGFLIWSAGSALYDVIEAFTPGFFVSNMAPTAFVYGLAATRLAGIATMIYAVLARRALDVRMVVRGSYRQLLGRRLLGAIVAAPGAGFGWEIVQQPNQTVGAALTDPRIGLLAAATVTGLGVFAGRRRLLRRLDAWVYPDSVAQGHLLAAASAELAQSGSAADVGEVVAGCVRRGCGATAVLFVADATDRHGFVAPAAGPAPLVRASAIAHALEVCRRSVPVAPDDAASVFDLLPGDDAAWVVATSAAMVVPVAGSGTAIIGVVAVGRRMDDRLPSPFDQTFVETVASAAGLALQRLRSDTGARDSAAPAARECPGCGLIDAADSGDRCGCGSAWRSAPVPRLLAGTFRLERRLGSGGMGTVYLARDSELDRLVAVKTLASTSIAGLVRLKQEARVMATVSHLGVAQIYGLESWRGRPCLIVEYLAQGTVADRLRRGPVPPRTAVGVASAVAGALTALHAAEHLHRDVKPSNIGFTAAGAVKLFDVGLACLVNGHDEPAGGTVAYLSPEVLRGGAPGAADDVWALAVVLFEMIAGRHPFVADGDDRQRIMNRIRRQRFTLPPAKDAPAPLAFAAKFLTAEAGTRSSTALAFAGALRAL